MISRTHRHCGSQGRTPLRLRARAGLSIVEVVVALVIFSIGLLGVAGTLVKSASSGGQMRTLTGRSATLALQLSRLSALPFDSLTNAAGCTTVTTPPFKHTRCVALISIAVGTGSTQVRLIVIPANAHLRADTVYLIRSRGALPNPLNY